VIGKVIENKYRIMDELGRGSLATVYLARDLARNLVVVLKVIHPAWTTEGQFLQRFQQEASLLQLQSSIQVARVLNYGEDEGIVYIVSEYVPGKTLASLLQETGPLPVDRALDIAKQVVLGLVDAHAKSIVHRDLRPANVLITAEGAVKVTDFGLAWAARLSEHVAEGTLYTPHYLSPEQASGGDVDGRSDLYSLGILLFEMLGGSKPYDGDSAADVVAAHRQAPIPSLRQVNADIPQEVDDLVSKCLAKRPEARYQSAAELLQAIDTSVQAMNRKQSGANLGLEADLVGQTLGAYRVLEQIGRGGMATVYKAYEPALDRYVAIKVLPQYFAHDPDFAARFEREARAVAKLNHPNILPIYRSGQNAGLNYIVMRYVEAGTLKDLLAQPIDLASAVDILGQVGRALDYAHQQGVIHRDVKPTNVLMADKKWALLTDFGLARMVESSVQLTKSGVGVGTPAYMSPEQGQGLKVDARSDVYSLGVMLYEMVTGKVPYEAETPMAVVLKHITAPLPLPRSVNPDLPDAIERVILKAMAKDMGDRYQTAGDMVAALERALIEAETWPDEIFASPETAVIPQDAIPQKARTVPQETVSPVFRAPIGAEAAETIAAGEEMPVPEAVEQRAGAPRPARRKLPWWAFVAGGVGLVAVVGLVLWVTGVLPTSWEPTLIEIEQPVAGKVVSVQRSSGERQLVVEDVQTGRQRLLTSLEAFSSAGDPVWSPDGEWVLFAVEQGEGHNDLYVVRADGEGLRPLLVDPESNLVNPSWSPDGEWIAMHANCTLQIAHVDGDEVITLRDPNPNEHCVIWPAWSPDGQWIAFTELPWEEMSDEHQVRVIHRDGSELTTLMMVDPEIVGEGKVAWSPDGQLIAYAEHDEGGEQWYAIDAGGEGEMYLLDERPISWFPDFWPQWSQEDFVQVVPPAAAAPGEFLSLPQPEKGRVLQPCGDKRPLQICVREIDDGKTIQVTKGLDFEDIDAFAWSPDGQQIVFDAGSDPDVSHEHEHDHDLYIVNADGSDLRQITSGYTNDIFPAWSADGEWIAFHRNGSLWIVRPDGSDAHVLLEGTEALSIEGIAWSPDGERLAFQNISEGAESFEAWVINRDGSDPRLVFSPDWPPGSGTVAWSPEGRHIACWRGGGREMEGVLVSVDDERAPQPIERDPWWWLPTFWPPWGEPPERPPEQPQEGKIVEPCEGETPRHICVRDVQTERVTRLDVDQAFENVGWWMSWSPDGARIVFDAGSDADVSREYDHDLYVVNADSSELRQITDGETNDVDPTWSPDGEWIVFHRNCGLWSVRPDGSGERMLLEGSEKFCASSPVWSPDGRQIAFWNTSDGLPTSEIWIVDRDGRNLQRMYLFGQFADWHVVSWTPDGRQIACMYGKEDQVKHFLINADGTVASRGIDLKDHVLWSWFPNYWPQWEEATGQPAPTLDDPWGLYVVPPGGGINIGLVADFSGTVNWIGPLKENAAWMAIEDRGPIRGFPVSVISADGGCQGDAGRAAAQRMAEDPSIVGIVGHTCSTSCSPAAPIYQGAYIVMISPSCTTPSLSASGYPILNRVAIRDDQEGDERNAGIVHTDAYQKFADRYRLHYDQPLDEVEMGFFVAYAYDATAVLLDALDRVAVLDPSGSLIVGKQALANEVRATIDYPGITGAISFDENGDRVP
jgi:serine/threonine protein kinase/Tol biopolymer transport system component/ABC-type branched-subunit amino acid transport system substrate-binding protein